MTMPRTVSDFKHLLGLGKDPVPQSPANSSGGMDRAIARKPRWRRYAIIATLAILACGAGVWALRGAGGNVYRVPVNRLTIGTVSQGPFEDYIAVRGAVAPFLIDYLTTDQGGTVKQVLVEDGHGPQKDPRVDFHTHELHVGADSYEPASVRQSFTTPTMPASFGRIESHAETQHVFVAQAAQVTQFVQVAQTEHIAPVIAVA